MSFSLLFLFAAVALIGSAAGGYFDLKTSEIPDEVPILISLAGIILYAFDFLFNKNAFPFVSILTTCGLFLTIGYLLFWLSQWGEADVLILASIGVLLPYLFSVPNTFGEALLFAGIFLIASFAIGGVYSIAFSIIIMVKNKKTKAFGKYLLKEKSQVRVISYVLIIGVILCCYTNYIKLYLLKNAILEFMVLIPTFYVLLKFAKFADSSVYKKKIKTSDLLEGDVIAEVIKETKPKEETGKPKSLFQKIIEFIKKILNIEGTRYEGITNEDIKKIQKKQKHVYVKDGVRYAPVFFFTILFFLLFKEYIVRFINF